MSTIKISWIYGDPPNPSLCDGFRIYRREEIGITDYQEIGRVSPNIFRFLDAHVVAEHYYSWKVFIHYTDNTSLEIPCTKEVA